MGLRTLFRIAVLQLSLLLAQGDCDTTKKPNILLLLTDDQDVVLGSFDHVPNVRRLIQEEGVTFQNGFVHTPICCPSRSSILTGRYLHNAGVQNNSFTGNCYGDKWKSEMENNHTYAVHAQGCGYTTAYIGKYLNEYGIKKGSMDVPNGWDHWHGLVGNSQYYNFTLIKGGTGKTAKRQEYSDKYPGDYLPNVMNDQVLEWFETLPEPWLIVAGWPTPHSPFTPAPWAEGTMSDYSAPITENYNASDAYMQQKHWLMRQLEPLSGETAALVDKYYQKRLEALKSVDKSIGAMIHDLERRSKLNNTVIMYTSDNGFQFGQHRLSIDKRHLYEHDIRVPFTIRGPGVRRNHTSQAIVANIDIAPTILDIVGKSRSVKLTMDGWSFWNHARGFSDELFDNRYDLLITYNGEGHPPCGMAECPPKWDQIMWMPDSTNNTYNCVRTLSTIEDSIYCRFEDDENFVEYYDLKQNPSQLQNDYTALHPVQRQRYDRRLKDLMSCAGPGCRLPF